MASRAIQARCRRTEGADARKVRRQHEAARAQSVLGEEIKRRQARWCRAWGTQRVEGEHDQPEPPRRCQPESTLAAPLSTLALPFRPNPNQEAAAAAREQEATQAAAASLEATQRLRTAMGSGRLALT